MCARALVRNNTTQLDQILHFVYDPLVPECDIFCAFRPEQQEKFNEIFKEARFSGDDLVHCESCRKKLEATSVSSHRGQKYCGLLSCAAAADSVRLLQTCEMVRHPQVLMLLLKRFELDYTTRSYSKCDRSVAVPLVLQAQVSLNSLLVSFSSTFNQTLHLWQKFQDNFESQYCKRKT